MTDLTLFVGLDLHKKTISVALVEGAAGAAVRFYGTIANTPETVRTICRKLSKDGQQLHFCYEAGPCGYGVHRHLTRLGHRCDVVAPALIPRKVGDRVKTDRRDLRKARQQLLSFLLRHGRNSPYGHWTKMHRRWLGELVFAHPAQHLALEEMLQRIERAEALCDRLKQAILELVPQWSLAPVVQAIQALRGVSLIVAAAIVAEVGCFSRFESPRALMAYLGLNPSEHSSGANHPARRHHQDRQHAGANLLGRGGLDLSVPAPGEPDHSRPAEGAARADPRRRLEGASAALGALPQAYRCRQAGAQGRGGDRARVGRLYLGDCPDGRTEVRLSLVSKQCTQGGEAAPARQTSAPNADGRLGR